MAHAMRVAISLPPAIYESVERARRKRKESRSEFFRHALQAFLRDLERREQVERYVEGYHRHPETVAEVDELRTLSHAALAGEPWD